MLKKLFSSSDASGFHPGEYSCTKQDIQYPRDMSSPVTLMIGGEEIEKPFYPPETVALTIADILQKYHKNNILPTITVCLYRAAAERFNSAGHAYYPESEQIIHIKQCLRKLDISEEDIDAIVFISSDTDAETRRYIDDFLNPETRNPLVQKLERLYRENSDFHRIVDVAVLEKFRQEPQAYKYVLFELAMILKKKTSHKSRWHSWEKVWWNRAEIPSRTGMGTAGWWKIRCTTISDNILESR